MSENINQLKKVAEFLNDLEYYKKEQKNHVDLLTKEIVFSSKNLGKEFTDNAIVMFIEVIENHAKTLQNDLILSL